jgi:hypothetical protein
VRKSPEKGESLSFTDCSGFGFVKCGGSKSDSDGLCRLGFGKQRF